MRVFFLLVLLAGLAGAGYPPVADRLGRGSREIGSFRVYEPASGFRAVSVPLVAQQAPVAVVLDLSLQGPAAPDAAMSSATVTASREGRTVLAAPVTFSGDAGRTGAPTTGTPATPRVFQALAGTIENLEDGTYTFTVARGEAEIPQVTALDLVLLRAPTIDSRVQPLGFVLAAIGFVGLVLAFSRRSAPTTAAAPPKPRWGRADA